MKKPQASCLLPANYSHIYPQKLPMRFPISIILCVSIFVFGCKPNKTEKTSKLNIELSKQIDKMANRDKQMQINVLQFANSSPEELAEVEDLRTQVYEKHANTIKEILEEYGYPGYKIVGKQSSDNFFTLMQHLQDFPAVMKLGIEKMEENLIDHQIETYQYISLKDQFAVLTESPQPFGTIVRFDENGKSYALNPADEIEKNRADMGMDSLSRYLDRKTIEYFNLNRGELEKKGIKKPILNVTSNN